MVGASNSWHPTTIHCFLVWVLTASHGLELGIDPGIATSTGPRVCWDSVRVEQMGEIPAVLWVKLETDLRVGKERDRMMKKVWRWLCKNSADKGRIYPGEGSSGGGRMGPSDVDWEHEWLEDGERTPFW